MQIAADKAYSVHEHPPFVQMPRVLSTSFTGRYGRLNHIKAQLIISLHEFAYSAALVLIIGIGAFYYSANNLEPSPTLIVVVILLFLAVSIPNMIYQIRASVLRLHDLNKPGVWFLLFFIPGVNMILAIYLFAAPGTMGLNDFGPPSFPSSKTYLIIYIVLCILGFLLFAAAMLFAGL